MPRANPRGFLKEVESGLWKLRLKAGEGKSWSNNPYLNQHLSIIRRLNNPEVMVFVRPWLLRGNVPGLGFGVEPSNKPGELDPAFQLEIWTHRNKAGYRYQDAYTQVETTRAVWSRHVHVAWSKKYPHIPSRSEFDLRHERDKALEVILQHAEQIAEFWYNKGAVALLHVPSLHFSAWKDERERQQYVVARVQDKRGNYVDTVWCAPVAKAKDDDTVLEMVLDDLKKYFGFGNWHEFDELGFSVTCSGGGYLDINYDKQKVVIRGQSEKYGPDPDRTHIRHLIWRVYYPGWDVSVQD